ncbi:MAG: hypothetical protein H6Q58_546 [Firmicutes bacterium]|nr:hypothetical protein [Bacillota bacterium]
MDNEELKGCGCGCGCSDSGCGDDAAENNCGCGCGDEHEHEVMSVDLEDEEGNIVSCVIVDGFDFKGSEYAIVENPENGAVYLFKVIGEGEEGELIVPEEDEFNEVSAYYEELLESESESELE